MSAHPHGESAQPLQFSEPIPLGADAVDVIDLLDDVEARTAARAREASRCG